MKTMKTPKFKGFEIILVEMLCSALNVVDTSVHSEDIFFISENPDGGCTPSCKYHLFKLQKWYGSGIS